MKNVTITDISGRDVDFDQAIDTDTVIASGGGVAVNGDLSDAAVNTGYNSGILAGDDVDLDDSIVGDGNTQVNDSTVGAFAARGNATNVTGENVNMGSGDLLDVDAEGDAQVAHGNANRFTGDVTTDLQNVDGPINLAIGDENRQNALEDNSTNFEDSFNTRTEDNDTTRWDWDSHDETTSTFEDNDSFEANLEVTEQQAEVFGEDNDLELEA